MVSYQYAPFVDGGAERQAQALAEELVRRGWKVAVATAHQPGLSRRETIGGVSVHRLPAISRRHLHSATFLPSLGLFLARRGSGYRIWHAHQAYYNAWIALEMGRIVGRPCIVKAAASGPWGDLARLRGRRAEPLVLKALRRADAIICLNEELRQEFEPVVASPAAIVTIANGVDLERFRVPTRGERRAARAALGIDESRRVVLYAGRLVPEKGIDDLLSAWPVVMRDASNVELLVAGGGDVERYRRLAPHPTIRWMGKVADLVPLLHASDMLVLPSKSEGLSNAVLEAMACGLPVIGTRIPGLSTQIAHERTGLLVPLGDVAALAEAISKLVRDCGPTAQMGRAARMTAESAYDMQHVVTRYEELYRRLLARSTSPKRSTNA